MGKRPDNIERNKSILMREKVSQSMKEILNGLGIQYQFQKRIGSMMVDFYIPDSNTVVFVDGEYWHNYPEGTEKDRMQGEVLKNSGYGVKRFWAEDVLKRKVDFASALP